MKAPKNWSEVKLYQYYALLDTLEANYDNNEERGLSILSSLTDIPVFEIENNYSIAEISEAIKGLGFIKDRTLKKALPSAKIGGKRFYFDMSLRDSTANNFINLSEYAKDPNRNMHYVMAIFCWEINWFGIKKKRTVQSQRDFAEFIKQNMTMDVAFGYGDFFLLSYDNLLKATQIFLKQKRMEILKKTKKTLDQLL
jgi:hypothetical protein